jgi:hypothetical protein
MDMSPDRAPAPKDEAEPGRLGRPMTSDVSGWRRWLPGLDTLLRYEPAWLAKDVVAGLVLTTMLVPVGIASWRPICSATSPTVHWRPS